MCAYWDLVLPGRRRMRDGGLPQSSSVRIEKSHFSNWTGFGDGRVARSTTDSYPTTSTGAALLAVAVAGAAARAAAAVATAVRPEWMADTGNSSRNAPLPFRRHRPCHKSLVAQAVGRHRKNRPPDPSLIICKYTGTVWLECTRHFLRNFGLLSLLIIANWKIVNVLFLNVNLKFLKILGKFYKNYILLANN